MQITKRQFLALIAALTASPLLPATSSLAAAVSPPSSMDSTTLLVRYLTASYITHHLKINVDWNSVDPERLWTGLPLTRRFGMLSLLSKSFHELHPGDSHVANIVRLMSYARVPFRIHFKYTEGGGVPHFIFYDAK